MSQVSRYRDRSRSELLRRNDSSAIDRAIILQARAVANRTLHARQIVRKPPHLVWFQAPQKAHQLVVDVEPMARSEVAHFLQQISIMLIAQRGNEAIVIAPTVFLMATAAELLVTRLAQGQVFPSPVCARLGGGKLLRYSARSAQDCGSLTASRETTLCICVAIRSRSMNRRAA